MSFLKPAILFVPNFSLLDIVISKRSGAPSSTYFKYNSLDPWTELNSVAVVRKRIIPTERPPLVDEVSANLCG
jgi:hypothetical protein